MARRRELKSVASGLAAHCVSRNNDISGYWGVGVLYRWALEKGITMVSVPMDITSSLPPELLAFRRHFLKRFRAARHGLSCFVEAFEVEFQFDPYSWSQVRGQCARVTCFVHLVDDLGKRRSASAVTFCYPHDPRFENQSVRVND